MTQSRYSICITELATEMPRCFSISIQSEVAWRLALRAFTEPAIWIAPENSSSFSVSVVLPASGCEMMAKVRRRRTSVARSGMEMRRTDARRRSETLDYRGRAFASLADAPRARLERHADRDVHSLVATWVHARALEHLRDVEARMPARRRADPHAAADA